MSASNKRINGYRLQYWLYAVLNKEFGKEVTFVRDTLHSIYAVNRHGFQVKSNTLNIVNVHQFLNQKLIDCGYVPYYKNSTGKFQPLVKRTDRPEGKEELYVQIDSNALSPTLELTVFAYWNGRRS